MSRLALVLGLVVVLAPGVSADLQGFKSDVEDAEAAPPKTKAPKPSPPPTPEDQQAQDQIWALGLVLWAADNLATTFGAYPYGPGGFVRVPEFWNAGSPNLNLNAPGGRDGWWSVESQAVHLDGLGTGAEVAVEGRFFRFLGPSLQVWTLTDGKDSLTGLRGGLSLALVQSDPLTLDAYLEAQLWSGVLNRAGGTVGLEARVYPWAPLALTLRAGAQIFEKFTLGETEARLGFLSGPWEFDAGWRWWTLAAGDPGWEKAFQGPFVAVKRFL